MTGTIDYPLPPPANENFDPLLRADTGLTELYRWRARLLNRDLSRLTFDQWQRHRKALEKLDKSIRCYLSHL
jgi:hypothetical protein